MGVNSRLMPREVRVAARVDRSLEETSNDRFRANSRWQLSPPSLPFGTTACRKSDCIAPGFASLTAIHWHAVLPSGVTRGAGSLTL